MFKPGATHLLSNLNFAHRPVLVRQAAPSGGDRVVLPVVGQAVLPVVAHHVLDPPVGHVASSFEGSEYFPAGKVSIYLEIILAACLLLAYCIM